MSSIIPYKGKRPVITEGVYFVEGCFIIGDIGIGRDFGVWFNTVSYLHRCYLKIKSEYLRMRGE